jgi:hypothetical protein
MLRSDFRVFTRSDANVDAKLNNAMPYHMIGLRWLEQSKQTTLCRKLQAPLPAQMTQNRQNDALRGDKLFEQTSSKDSDETIGENPSHDFFL